MSETENNRLKTEGFDCKGLVMINIWGMIQSLYFGIKNNTHFHPESINISVLKNKSIEDQIYFSPL